MIVLKSHFKVIYKFIFSFTKFNSREKRQIEKYGHWTAKWCNHLALPVFFKLVFFHQESAIFSSSAYHKNCTGIWPSFAYVLFISFIAQFPSYKFQYMMTHIYDRARLPAAGLWPLYVAEAVLYMSLHI